LLIKNQDRLSFRIKDELSGIAEYRVDVNGSWVLMNYDYKKNLIWSEKLDPNNPFQGELILKVTDNLGNENIYTTKL
ncbi:MAG: M23 family peptidase, partial [Bacteroidetes bacterium]|nr:M23 family peptidase [Bacteroidota bacterium]